MEAFLLYIGTGEKVPLEKQKPVILGRGSGALKSVNDTRIARNQVEVRFLGNVLRIQNIGSNQITVTTKNNDDRKKKIVEIPSQGYQELINGDSFTLILPGENVPSHNYTFRFQGQTANLKNSISANNEEDKTIEVPEEQIKLQPKKQKEEDSPTVAPKKGAIETKTQKQQDPLKNISKSSATYKTVKEKREEQLVIAQQEGPVKDEMNASMSLELHPVVPAVATSSNKMKDDMDEDEEEENSRVPQNKQVPKPTEASKPKAKPKEASKKEPTPLKKSNENNNEPSKLKKSIDNNQGSTDSIVNKIPSCKYGLTCYNTKEEHLDQFVHPCKFGNSCYRKDPVHRQRYTHGEETDSKPSKEAKPTAATVEEESNEEKENAMDEDNQNEQEAQDDEEEVEPEMLPDGITALKGMKEDVRIQVQGGSSNYEIMKKGPVYSCTCHAWKNQSFPLDKRSCKHLAEYLGMKYGFKDVKSSLGADFERVRLGGKKGDSKKEDMAAELTGINKKSTVTGKTKPTKQVPKLLLAHKWEISTDPTGYWISEKLDGVRAYWNGKVFISRLGNEFTAPDYFKEGLPTDMTLDGELWVGRKMFQLTVGIVRSSGASELWKKLQYKVFDSPDLALPFEGRMKKIKGYFKEHKAPYVAIVPQEKCTGVDHVKKRLQEVEKLGGEGLMLREAGSVYAHNRSTTLLKVKSFFDAEAKIIKYEPGKGKHSGKVGAFWCDMGNGKNFSVGTGLSDYDREHPPAIGTIITYRYQELTDAGIPRFPSYVGVRADAVWPPDPDSLPKSVPNPKKTKTKPANNNNNKNKEADDDEPPVKKQKKGK